MKPRSAVLCATISFCSRINGPIIAGIVETPSIFCSCLVGWNNIADSYHCSTVRWENGVDHQAIPKADQDEVVVEQQTRLSTPPPALLSSDEENHDSEDDEYVAESEKVKGGEPTKVCCHLQNPMVPLFDIAFPAATCQEAFDIHRLA